LAPQHVQHKMCMAACMHGVTSLETELTHDDLSNVVEAWQQPTCLARQGHSVSD
jgi:hypothetical protein